MTLAIQPPSVLLQGAPGAGKTDSLVTLAAAGLDVFVIITEPGGVESLLDSAARRKVDVNRLHWATVQPASTGWSAMDSMIKTIANQGFEDIQKIKNGVGKDQTRIPAMKLLTTFQRFVCERDGKDYGDVTKWGPDRALVVDSLSGLSTIAWALTVGQKPAAHQGEYGVAMNFVEQLILKLTSDRSCFFVLTAHVEKEINELTGVAQVMASTIGRKLSPKIPRFFSKVVYAKRGKAQAAGTATFTWSTVDATADLKNRALPIGDALTPDFVPVVEAYRRRMEQAAPATAA